MLLSWDSDSTAVAAQQHLYSILCSYLRYGPNWLLWIVVYTLAISHLIPIQLAWLRRKHLPLSQSLITKSVKNGELKREIKFSMIIITHKTQYLRLMKRWGLQKSISMASIAITRSLAVYCFNICGKTGCILISSLAVYECKPLACQWKSICWITVDKPVTVAFESCILWWCYMIIHHMWWEADSQTSPSLSLVV